MDQPSSFLWRPARQGITTLLAAGLLLNGGCGLIRPRGTGLTPPMPVASPLRKQVLQGFMPFGSIAWVNDEQVVFHGVPVGTKASSHSLFVWDQRGEPRELLNRSHGSCVSGGVIRALEITDLGEFRTVSLRGPDFIPHPLRSPGNSGAGLAEPVTCSWIATPSLFRERIWKPLRKGQGFLDFGPDALAPPLRRVEHLAVDGSTRHDTGIRMERPMLPRADHSTYDGSYLIYDLNQTPAQLQRWIQTNTRTIWQLDRQLRSRPLVIPAGSWVNPVGGSLSFLPARPGLLLISNNFGRNRSPGGAGLYLLPPGTAIQRLERGMAQNAAVSPNGCRVAYAFQPWLSAPIVEGGPRLVVLDLCRTPPGPGAAGP